MTFWLSGFLAFWLFGASSPALADAVRGVRSAAVTAVAPRGGVLMLPLIADRPGDHWPQTLELQTADKRPLIGLVAWIAPGPARAERHWTDDPRQLLIRAVQPDDDSAAIDPNTMTGPVLLLRLPRDGTDPLRLGKQVINVDWRDVPGPELPTGDENAPPANHDRPTLALAPGLDRPDPVSPFEYWRWVLLADRLDFNPPPPFGGALERMAAEYYAALWRIGLERLARPSPRVAEQCRAMLTNTCIDRRQVFAAWVADPVQINSLLSRLLDFHRPDTGVLSDAVAWIDEQPPLFLWPESEASAQVRLALVTPLTEPIVVRFSWAGSAEPPTAVQVEPGVLTQVNIDRPAPPKPSAIGLPPPPEPVQQVLQIEAGGRRQEVTFGPRVTIAKPPGVFFRRLSPPLTLAEAQAQRQRVVPQDRATTVHVRRLSGRWEVFFDCRRPGGNVETSKRRDVESGSAVEPPGSSAAPPMARDDQAGLPDAISSFDDLRGIEAVTLLLGAEDGRGGPAVWLAIPERGFWRTLRGDNDGTLQIHKKSYPDRWLCRVVLPESWFSAAETSPAFIGFMRGHGDSSQLETGPIAVTPWKVAPARAAVNLEQWDDLPPAEDGAR